MGTTSPDNIFFPDTSTPWATTSDFSVNASSVQTALNFRQRYEFVWATSTQRTAQAGMRVGDTGFQLDTKSEYIYDTGGWRLKFSYVEYSGSGSVTTSTYVAPVLSVNSGNSTDTTFTSNPSAGVITFAQPGIYSIAVIEAQSGGSSGTTNFALITSDVAHTQFISIAPFTALVANANAPFFRTTAANTSIYIWIFQSSGSTQTVATTVRIGRFN